jgi:hypothetical protein
VPAGTKKDLKMGAVSKRVRSRLQLWAKRKTTLTAYISVGPAIERRNGGHVSAVHGVFSVRFATTSLMLVPEFLNSATIEKLGKYRTVTIQDQHGAAVRLTDDVTRIGPTEAEIKKATDHLNAWAKTGTVILYSSGTRIHELAFFGRVRGQEEDGGFLIAGMKSSDPNESSEGFGARIFLKSADSLKVYSTGSSRSIIMRQGDTVFHIAVPTAVEDEHLMALWPPSSRIQ